MRPKLNAKRIAMRVKRLRGTNSAWANLAQVTRELPPADRQWLKCAKADVRKMAELMLAHPMDSDG